MDDLVACGFGHIEQMKESKMTRKVYVSEIEGRNARKQPPVKWRDRVQEYVKERDERSCRNTEQARRECLDRERWKLFCYGHSLVGVLRSRCQRCLSGKNVTCNSSSK